MLAPHREALAAPFVINRAMNADIFRAYVEKVLAPELRLSDIVIMDNLSSHKVPGVAEAITAKGAELRYLPRQVPVATKFSWCTLADPHGHAVAHRFHC